eukprot:jgi/Mesvir1/8615/Mv26221-RA.1
MSALKNGTRAAPPGQWSTPLSDCMADGLASCLMGFCCTCVTFGHNAEAVDGTGCKFAGALYEILFWIDVCCVYSTSFRTRIRHAFQIPGSPATDCLLHWFCPCCAVLQENHELKVRGFTEPGAVRGTSLAPPPQIIVGQPMAPVPHEQQMQRTV